MWGTGYYSHLHNRRCTSQAGITRDNNPKPWMHSTHSAFYPEPEMLLKSAGSKTPATQTWSRLETYMQVNVPWISNSSLTGVTRCFKKICRTSSAGEPCQSPRRSIRRRASRKVQNGEVFEQCQKVVNCQNKQSGATKRSWQRKSHCSTTHKYTRQFKDRPEFAKEWSCEHIVAVELTWSLEEARSSSSKARLNPPWSPPWSSQCKRAWKLRPGWGSGAIYRHPTESSIGRKLFRSRFETRARELQLGSPSLGRFSLWCVSATVIHDILVSQKL
jgi:hypothetical protein